MPLQAAAEFAKREAFLHREVPGMGHGRITNWHDMAVRKDQTIPSFPVRIFGVMIENAEIERSKDIRHTERAGGMA